jgi:pimeloyl-ACP methyl ester carboxylesterase
VIVKLRWKLLLAGSALLAALVLLITRDGSLVEAKGSGWVEALGDEEFESLSLPDYAAGFIDGAYKSYLIEVEPGIKIHVLEVGQGRPIYAQHGNPTNGFLYRKVAAELPLDRERVIMPTMVGLGFSTKVPASLHTLENHMRWMNTALNKLDLADVVYVGQDWGGPVGMGALSLSPDMLSGAVLMNTGLDAPREKMDLSRAHALVKTPVVGELLLEVFANNFWENLANVQGDPASIPSDVMEVYRRPLDDSGNAKAPLALMRMVSEGPDHPDAGALRDIERYVDGLQIPAELVWGMSDPILAKGLAAMETNFPAAPVTRTDASHFLQEEVPAVIAGAVMRVVNAVHVTTAEI